MPVLIARGNIPTKSWPIVDALLTVILLVVGVILVYWIRRSYREYKQCKGLSKKLLDIEACTPVQDGKTVHTKSKPEFYQVPSIPPTAHIPSRATYSQRHITTTSKFDSFAPIHDHVIHIPKPGDYCAASQKLKRSFSEGAHECSGCPSFTVRQIVAAAINDASKQSSFVVVPSGKSRLASAIEGRATTEVAIQERCASASPIQEQTCGKVASQKLLDAKACMTTKKERNACLSSRTDLRAISATNFDSFAPIHDYLIHIPTAEDYCAASQKLKKSFSEGIHDYSRYPRFPVRPTIAATINDARHSLVAGSSQVPSDGVMSKRQLPYDMASSLLTTTIEERSLIDGVAQECHASRSVPACQDRNFESQHRTCDRR